MFWRLSIKFFFVTILISKLFHLVLLNLLDEAIKPDECSLEYVSVDLNNAFDNTTNTFEPNQGYLFYPSSVRVKRCIGYCGKTSIDSELRQCLPDGLIKVKKVLQVVQIIDQNLFNHVNGGHVQIRRRQVPVETHTNCRCGCKSNPTGKCPLPTQKFIPEICRCSCMNLDIKEQCSINTFPWGDMFWDETRCKCRCPQFYASYQQLKEPPQMCSSAFIFNHVKCRYCN